MGDTCACGHVLDEHDGDHDLEKARSESWANMRYLLWWVASVCAATLVIMVCLTAVLVVAT